MNHELLRICRERGLSIRKQLPDIPSWTIRTPTVVDLSPEEEQALQEGRLPELLAAKGEFIFPAWEISSPRPFERDSLLAADCVVIYPRDNAFLAELARTLATLPDGTEMRVLDDNCEMPCRGTVILLGDSSSNRHSQFLAARQLLFASGQLPGPNGWSIETIHSLVNRKQNIIACSVSPATRQEFLKHWWSSLQKTSGGFVRQKDDQFRIAPKDSALAEVLSPNRFLGSILNLPSGPWQDTSLSLSQRCQNLAEVVSEAFDCGGPSVGRDNGHCTMVMLVKLYYAYAYTRQREYLEAFRTILLGLAKYFLTIPGGASYLSDYDFYLGYATNAFALAEADPIFSADDRLLLTSVLYASMRQIHLYACQHWPIKPGQLRFNHETFPALNLGLGATYFSSWLDFPEIDTWWEYGKLAFSGPVAEYWRQRENSNSYQWIVPSQKLAWDMLTTGTPSPCFRNIAQAVYTITDNFGQGIAYGDAAPLQSWSEQDMIFALVQCQPDAYALYLAHRYQQDNTFRLPIPGWGMLFRPALQQADEIPCGHWETTALLPHVRERLQVSPKLSCPYDKIALRSGNRPEDQYLLFEPYGGDGHGHRDVNAILAYNQQGRIWLVDNGYGFAVDNKITDMGKRYSTREIGPRCHNTLLFYRPDGELHYTPNFAHLAPLQRIGEYAFLETCLGGIEGLVWFRTILLKIDAFILIVDRVVAQTATSLTQIECLLNGLGEDTLTDNVWKLEQQGITATLQFAGDGQASTDQYCTTGWQSALPRLYPYANPPVKQLRRCAAAPAQGQEIRFFSLFTTKTGYTLNENGLQGNLEPLHIVGKNGTMQAAGNTLSWNFSSELPDGLQDQDFHQQDSAK